MTSCRRKAIRTCTCMIRMNSYLLSVSLYVVVTARNLVQRLWTSMSVEHPCHLKGFIVSDLLACGLPGFLTYSRFVYTFFSLIRFILNFNNPHHVIGLSCGCVSWDLPVFILIVCNKRNCIVLYSIILSSVDGNPMGGSTRVRGLTPGDSFSLLCIVHLCNIVVSNDI